MTVQSQNKLVKAFSDLVGLFDTKPRAAATVGMILVILYLWYRNDQLNAARIQDQKDFNAAIVAEVRKQVKPIAEDLRNKQNITRVKVDSTRAELAPVIKSIKETVNKINKKQKQ